MIIPIIIMIIIHIIIIMIPIYTIVLRIRIIWETENYHVMR